MNLSRMQSRTAAIAVLLVLITAVVSLIVVTIDAYEIRGASIAQKTGLISQYQRLAAGHDMMKKQLTEIKRRSPASVYYITGKTSALAAANVQRLLKQIVEENGGKVISTQILDPGSDQQPPSAGLKVHMKGGISGFLQVLHQLETGRPMFFLDNLSISIIPRRSVQQEGDVELDIRFDLTAYLKETI